MYMNIYTESICVYIYIYVHSVNIHRVTCSTLSLYASLSYSLHPHAAFSPAPVLPSKDSQKTSKQLLCSNLHLHNFSIFWHEDLFTTSTAPKHMEFYLVIQALALGGIHKRIMCSERCGQRASGRFVSNDSAFVCTNSMCPSHIIDAFESLR